MDVNVTTRSKATKEHVFKDRKPRKAKNVVDWEKKRTIEKVNGGNKLINLEDIDLAKRAIHNHGRMEHNFAGYAKYYSYGSIKISGGSEFTREIDYSRKDFSRHW
jgi:hypothetical protein